MKVRLVFVPPGGGEQDYYRDFEMPGVPQAGDYISVMRPGTHETSDFIVRRTWWHLEYPENTGIRSSDNPVYGSVHSVVVECEFAKGIHSNAEHLRACETYARQTGKLKEFEASGY
jgi:hypothetical protein